MTGSQLPAVVFAGIFAVAFLAKADAWTAWRDLTESIAPRWFGHLVRYALPSVEVAVVVALVLAPTAGLIGAAALLVILCIAILVFAKPLAGKECNCFGAISSAEVGRSLVLRNAVLSIAAGAGACLSFFAEAGPLDVAGIAVVATVVVAIFVVGAGRQFINVARDTRGSLL